MVHSSFLHTIDLFKIENAEDTKMKCMILCVVGRELLFLKAIYLFLQIFGTDHVPVAVSSTIHQ